MELRVRALNFSCFYAFILFLSFTQFAKRRPALQENRKILVLKNFSWSRRFLIPEYASLCNQWKTKTIRHLGLVLHVRGFHATRTSYYANSHSTFHQMRLYISGDIDLNPGPDECSVCNKRVARNHRAVSCDNCSMWCHMKCASIKPSEYKIYQSLPSFSWWCPRCLWSSLPFRNETTLDHSLDSPITATCYNDVHEHENLYPSLKADLQLPGLKISHINVNGLLNKLLDIKALLFSIKFDILAITESHLSEDISDDEIAITGYKTARRDRNDGRKGGGTVIYVAEYLDAYERQDIDVNNSLEAAWIDVTVASQRLLVASIYRPPDNTTFLNQFSSTLDRIWMKRTNIILLGDFNFNLLPNAQDTNSSTWKFRQLLNKFNLKNVINKATRITDTSTTLIDLVICSDTSKISHQGVCDLGISDHHLIYAIVNLKRKRQRPTLKTVYDYKKVDLDSLRMDFAAAPWSICNIFDDLDDATWAWECLYKDIMKSHIQARRVKIRNGSLPWMNSSIRKELNKRYKLLLKAQQTPKGSQAWINYKKARNHCNKLLRSAESNYWLSKFNETTSAKDFWKTVRSFEGKRTITNIGPIKDSSGVIHLDDTSKAIALNSFFVNVGKSLSKSTQDSSVNFPRQSARNNSVSLYDIALHKDLLKSSLKRLKPGKASGPDDISSRELRLIGDAFLDCFMPLAQRSILECKFPSQWKQAQVKCVHKKGSTLDCGNYRPISLLSIPGKLLENVVSQQLDNFLYGSNLISMNQWGFRKGGSPELLLLSLTEQWRLALDESNIIGVVFIDFQKAFDCVNHTVLKDKLHSIGITGSFYDWLLNYLENRKQFVTVNGSNSELLEIDTGVPQGSLLGPRLYSIYSSDLPGATTNASVEMFADDTTAFCIGKTVDEVLSNIQKAIADLNKWAKDNFMTIHPAKTELMLLSKSKFIGPLQKICLGPNELSFVSKATCLGIHIDNKLSWSQHVKSLSKRFSARVKKLKHLKGLDNHILESIYFKGIIPSITYSIALWGSSKSLQTLEDIHIRAARFIFNIKESTLNTEVLAKTKWKSLSYIYKKRIATISYQAFYNRAPAGINSLFTKQSPLRNLRDGLKLYVQRPRSDFLRSSFSHRASLLWNSLPVYLKSKPNIVSFKSALKAKSDILDKITFNGLQGINKDIVNYIY